jgi:hypothetical protein
MTTTPRLTAAIALAMACLGAPAVMAQGPLELYYERVLMSTAGERCKLFTPDIASGLNAAAAQARGAALRSGADEKTLDAVRRRAELKAYGAACKGKDMTVAAERVRNAFSGYGKIWKMNFPGARGGWSADRAQPGKQGEPRWRLSQAQGEVRFGILADSEGERLTVVFPAGRAEGAASARLLLRDPAKAARPYIDNRKAGLAGSMAPRASSVAFLANGKGAAPASVGGGVAFSFPASAMTALERLDPREAATVELVFPSRRRERVEKTLIEIGDFAAGRAFLAAR